MNLKKVGTVSVLIVSVAILAIVVVSREPGQLVAPGQNEKATLSAMSSQPLPTAKVVAPEMQPIVQRPNTSAEIPAVERPQRGEPQTQQARAQAGKPAKSKPPIQDPAARVALGLVGADPDAEEYWYAAINDSTLSPHERKDLIEDLNEDGLSDPKHPGPQDMPLIWSRIRIIEMVGPFAMDEVNADAFAEAYKDLVNLASGRPAQ